MVIFLNVLIRVSVEWKSQGKCTKGYYNDFGSGYKKEIDKFVFFGNGAKCVKRGNIAIAITL